jgi:hypothetical protein
MLYSCVFFIDIAEHPIFIFCLLKDRELIEEFSDEVSIKTDGVQMLPRKYDYPALVELKQSVFGAVRNTKEFDQLVNAFKRS